MTREETPGAPQGPAVTLVTVAGLFGRLVGLALALGVAVGLLLTAAAVALPAPAGGQETGPERATSGRFLMRRAHDEPWVTAPTLSTDVSFRFAGVVARASVRQRFRNGTDEWVEGVYVLPLPRTAAVEHLLMRVGERTIEGPIREREQRPHIFMTSVASLSPGEELLVEIQFRQALVRDDVVPVDRDFERTVTAAPATLPAGALFREERGGATDAHGSIEESVVGELPRTATPASIPLFVAILWLLAAAALRVAARPRDPAHRS